MPGQGVRLGPFIGGLNNVSDMAAVADNELVDIVNLEVDFEGALKSRPPITSVGTTGGTTSVRLLGYYILNNTSYLIGSFDGKTAYWNGSTWINITTTFAARVMVQYGDKAWLIPGEGTSDVGGSWSPVGSFTADADIPKGSSACVHKERVWVATASNSRVQFSAIADPGNWPANDYFDVNSGDGENIVLIKSYSNGIYIWKNDSTYVFQYSAAPTEGTVQNISPSIGASGEWCVVEYENYQYVYHEGRVYELVNFNYGEITTKVRFENRGTVSSGFLYAISMTRFRDRILLRYFDNVYVFQLKTRTWSRWESSHNFGPLFQQPQFNSVFDTDTAFAGSWVNNDPQLYRIQDVFNTTNSETYTCYIQTKTYDYGESFSFKRLFWWGADLLAQSTVTATASPVVYSGLFTHGQMEAYTFGDFENGTWGQLITPIIKATSVVNSFGTGSRKFIKFLKSLRFRQVRFELWVNTQGTVNTGPVQIFGLTTFIRGKETVSKQVS